MFPIRSWRSRRTPPLAFACSLALQLVLAAPGSAVEPDPAAAPSPAAAQPPGEVAPRLAEEILVTAEKRPESLGRVGAAVTPFGGEELELLGWHRPVELGAHAPNVTVKDSFGNANPIFVIRGVGIADFNANTSPSAGLYLDEVPLTSPLMLGLQLFDIAGIEVLRGPQGTLYGRNTTAGAVNVITRRPDGTRAQRLTLGWGRYDTLEAEGALAGDLGRGWSHRVAFLGKRSSDGPFENRTRGMRTGDVDLLGWRAGLAWNPGGRTEASLNIHGGRDRSDGYESEHLGLLDPAGGGFCAPFLAGGHDPTRCVDLGGYSDADGDPFAGDWNVPAEHHHRSVGASAKVARAGERLLLTAVTGWERFGRRQWLNADASPQVGADMRFDTEIEEVTQEVRAINRDPVALPGGRYLNYLVGAFASYDRVEGQPNQLFALDEWLGTRVATSWRQSTTSAALFAHSEWLLAPRFNVTAGARQTWEAKDFRGSTVDLNPFGTSCLLHPACAPGFVGPFTLSSTDDTLSDSHLSLDLGAEAYTRGGRMVYASVRQGYKSGGYNGGLAASDFELEPYVRESLLAYELGFKTAAGPRGGYLNAAAFLYDYRDLQLFAIRTNAGGLPTVVLTNAADARVAGVELELRLRPAEGLDVRLSGGLLDTELEEFQYGPQDLSGNELPNAPERQAGAIVAWSGELRPGIVGFLAANYAYTGATFKEPTNHPLFRAEGYGLLAARAGVERGRWQVALWGKNLTDERYVTEMYDQRAVGQGLRIYGWPRSWGVSVTWRGD
jgi:iron complex outermembrane recepter protein